MVLLDNDAFCVELGRLFVASRQSANNSSNPKASSSTMSITMKKYDGRVKPQPRAGKPQSPQPTEYKCLFRAKLRNKKISTVVNAKDINKFQIQYTQVLSKNMDKFKRPKDTKKTDAKQKRKKAAT